MRSLLAGIPSVPGLPTRLSFDFAFSTAPDTSSSSSSTLDSFAVSLLTLADSDFLDILVVDASGLIPDPSDGIESSTGAIPIDVAYVSTMDPTISILGFNSLPGGTTFSGRISLFLPSIVLGEDATIFFDLLDQKDGSRTIAAVDNLAVEPVPEPATVILLRSGLVGLIGWGRRKFSISA